MLKFYIWKYNLIVILICLFTACIFSGYRPAQNSEYRIKSVFIYNFSQFIEWPTSAFSSSDAPFIIGILGRDPFGSYINEVVKGESINGHPFIVRRYDDIQEASSCHILYIGENDKGQLQKIINDLGNKSILTISDTRDFTKMGGVIEFTKKENKIGLKINPQAAKKAQLLISSKLLRLAEIVSN